MSKEGDAIRALRTGVGLSDQAVLEAQAIVADILAEIRDRTPTDYIYSKDAEAVSRVPDTEYIDSRNRLVIDPDGRVRHVFEDRDAICRERDREIAAWLRTFEEDESVYFIADRLERGEFSHPPTRSLEEAARYVLELLRQSSRIGAATDEPEGARWIRWSDTLAKRAEEMLARALGEGS